MSAGPIEMRPVMLGALLGEIDSSLLCQFIQCLLGDPVKKYVLKGDLKLPTVVDLSPVVGEKSDHSVRLWPGQPYCHAVVSPLVLRNRCNRQP